MMGNWYIVREVLNKSCRLQTPKDFTKCTCYLLLNIFAQSASWGFDKLFPDLLCQRGESVNISVLRYLFV